MVGLRKASVVGALPDAWLHDCTMRKKTGTLWNVELFLGSTSSMVGCFASRSSTFMNRVQNKVFSQF